MFRIIIVLLLCNLLSLSSIYFQLTQAINTCVGLLQRIGGYKSVLEGSVGSNNATVAFVKERFAKDGETIRTEL